MLIIETDACPVCLGIEHGCESCAHTGRREAHNRLHALEMQIQADEIAESRAIAALDEAIELAERIGERAAPIVRKCEEALRALGVETVQILPPTMVDRVQRWAVARRAKSC